MYEIDLYKRPLLSAPAKYWIIEESPPIEYFIRPLGQLLSNIVHLCGVSAKQLHVASVTLDKCKEGAQEEYATLALAIYQNSSYRNICHQKTQEHLIYS